MCRMINGSVPAIPMPECGVADREHGRLLTAHEIHWWFAAKKTAAFFGSTDGRSSKSNKLAA